ncbi:MAG: SCP2 sterol-binding domain-containing protein [Mycobacterium sp.]|nr:SCP2 sterol-binding domain-containing protein [Mycobacterium sp.]
MTADDIDDGLPRLPIFDGTKQPQHRPAPTKLTLTAYPDRAARPVKISAGAEEIRELALQSGADDVGLVPVEREDMAAQRSDIEELLPGARTAIAFVVKMNRGNVRAPARSVANGEFHHSIDETNEVARRITRELETRGHRAVCPPGGFPMEVDRFPGKIWTISMKPIAVAAGLGQMGIHRNVIHPRFGNFVLIGVVLTDAEIDTAEHARPIDLNPCLGCKLCVAACPVGAIKTDGGFDFAACTTHNYREFLGGFSDWVHQVTDSDGQADYRSKVPVSETMSIWQSLSFGANYKAAYCMSVCPAGDDVIGPYLADRKQHIADVVKPLTDKPELIYVTKGSDAEAHVRARFPHKQIRRVSNGLAPATVEAFVAGSPLVFAAKAAKDVVLRVHFAFRGSSSLEVTYVIDHGTLRIEEGRTGEPDLSVKADADTWLAIASGEKNPLWAVLSGKLRITGSRRHFDTFKRCFPL